MNSLSEILNNSSVKQYFSDFSEEETKRRIAMFLEIAPFLLEVFLIEEPDTKAAKLERFSRIAEELRSEFEEIVINAE